MSRIIYLCSQKGCGHKYAVVAGGTFPTHYKNSGGLCENSGQQASVKGSHIGTYQVGSVAPGLQTQNNTTEAIRVY